MRKLRGLFIVATLLLVPLALGACGDDDEKAPTPSPALTEEQQYDGYARSICLASRGFVDGVTALGPGSLHDPKQKDAILKLWDGLIVAMEKASPPEAMKSFHAEWVAILKDDVAKLHSGGPDAPNDPFDRGPTTEPPKDVQEKFSAAMARVPECKPDSSQTPPPTTTQLAPNSGDPLNIDYSAPSKFLLSGPQSTFDSATAQSLRNQFGGPGSQLQKLGAIYRWMSSTFQTVTGGGAEIGKTTAMSLLGSKTFTGCHDWALMMTAAARLMGIPAIMADSAGIQWAEDFRSGKTQSFSGHVFGEFYVDGGWIVVDCTSGQFATGYDHSNLVIPATNPVESKGYYVMFKGIDPQSYGVTSAQVLNERMRLFAEKLTGIVLTMPSYTWKDLRDQ